jgi:uncharacterized protein
MPSDVYFIDFRASLRRTLLDRFADLLVSAGFGALTEKKKLLAIKMHFGEIGNTAYLRPYFARRAAEEAIKRGAIPYLTDCNTLYVGSRGRAPEHLYAAYLNGYDYMGAGCPVIIGDGVRGDTETVIAKRILNDEKQFYVGSEILRADGLLVLSHFKGHEQTGFGGCIKNLGMGGGSRRGKLAMHSGNTPTVDSDTCTGCASCERWCITGAIRVDGGTAKIDPDLCIGCGQCIVACPEGATENQWDASTEQLNRSITEYCYAIASQFGNRVLYVNVINQVSPACDCWSVADAPIVPDIGIVAGTDAVAVDNAAVDLVNQSVGLANSALGNNIAPGTDKFRTIFPDKDWSLQLNHGEKIGLGNRDYKLIKLR